MWKYGKRDRVKGREGERENARSEMRRETVGYMGIGLDTRDVEKGIEGREKRGGTYLEGRERRGR